jgi:hypothetical protein
MQKIYGQGVLTLFDGKENSDGRRQISKRIEFIAENDTVKMVTETTTYDAEGAPSELTKREARLSIEDFMALIQAYLEIIS